MLNRRQEGRGIGTGLARFIIGLCALADDNNELAKEHFRTTRDAGVYHTSDYYWAKAYLTLLDAQEKHR